MATLLQKHLKLEEIKKIRNWRNEGYGLEKIKELVDKTIITDDEIKEVFYENNQNLDIQEKENQFEDNNHIQEEVQEQEVFTENELMEKEDTENTFEQKEPIDFEENTIEDLEEIEEEELEIIEDEVPEEDELPEKETEIKANERYEIIKDEDLEDFPNQPFKMYSESRKNSMIESIKINGIIEPIVVRKTDNGNYQILSGHNRRLCGREAGLKEFKCIVKENMTDDEASLYMVDSNLMVRDVMPTEKGKYNKSDK